MLFIFDMGGVVTNTYGWSDYMIKKLSVDKEGFFSICSGECNEKCRENKTRGNDIHGSGNDIFSQLTKGLISTDDFWNEYNARAVKKGLPSADRDLFRLSFHPTHNTKTVEIINKLKQKHRVVCGTNTIQSHWENHMERGDYAYFHQTYASNKIKAEKPDTEFFKLILEAENALPEETFFTDDKIENCLAAQKLGIHAVQFTAAELLEKEWQKYF